MELSSLSRERSSDSDIGDLVELLCQGGTPSNWLRALGACELIQWDSHVLPIRGQCVVRHILSLFEQLSGALSHQDHIELRELVFTHCAGTKRNVRATTIICKCCLLAESWSLCIAKPRCVQKRPIFTSPRHCPVAPVVEKLPVDWPPMTGSFTATQSKVVPEDPSNVTSGTAAWGSGDAQTLAASMPKRRRA